MNEIIDTFGVICSASSKMKEGAGLYNLSFTFIDSKITVIQISDCLQECKVGKKYIIQIQEVD